MDIFDVHHLQYGLWLAWVMNEVRVYSLFTCNDCATTRTQQRWGTQVWKQGRKLALKFKLQYNAIHDFVMTKRRHCRGHYLTSGLWVMSVPQREKGWHHSRVIILFGWAPIESFHYARGGLLSENHVTFWYSASCTQLENAYSLLHAMCGCVKKDQVVFAG